MPNTAKPSPPPFPPATAAMSSAEAPAARAYRSRSRSASAIVGGTVTGHHLLNIEGYSHTKELPTGQYIKSRPFMVDGRLWRIKYYPNGDRPAKADYVSIYLNPGESFAQPVKARVRFSLVDLAGKPVPSQTLTTELHSFTVNGFGFADFMERKELDMSEHLVNDCFTIRCDVIIYKEVRTEDRSSPLVIVPPSDLHVHFGDLLATKDGADVTFQVAGETITAHRCVLAARSPVFKAQFFGSMKEGAKSHCIHIEDMMPEVFNNLMHFIYTDSLPEMKEQEEAVMVQHMLEAADRRRQNARRQSVVGRGAGPGQHGVRLPSASGDEYGGAGCSMHEALAWGQVRGVAASLYCISLPRQQDTLALLACFSCPGTIRQPW